MSGNDDRLRHGGGLDRVDLYWIPLGAGAPSVRFNGIIYEAVLAMAGHRPRCDIYHSALEIVRPDGLYTVEMTPVPDDRGRERGVVAEGPVGIKAAGRVRLFRYEVRRWRNGLIPDLGRAVASPQLIARDANTVERIFQLLPDVPRLTWGRDERRTGDMWSCNSIISWALTGAGVPIDGVALPRRGRAPGWDAGITIAREVRDRREVLR